MGNTKGNRYWEARLPRDFRRPPSGNPNPELAAFIRSKYVDRTYAATDVAQPPTIDAYEGHPYAKEDEGSAAGTGVSGAASPAPGGSQTGTPHKASTAATVDLLGGFDDPPVASPSAAARPPPPATVPVLAPASASTDLFSAFVSAPPPPPAASAPPPKRVSLEWTDFHGAEFAAAPTPSATQPAAPAVLPPAASSSSAGGSHNRSFSISEGFPGSSGNSFAAGPSRMSGHAAPHHAHGHGTGYGHHGHHGGHHAGHGDPGSARAAPRHQASSSDPFAALAGGDDLLAGLTIHQVRRDARRRGGGRDGEGACGGAALAVRRAGREGLPRRQELAAGSPRGAAHVGRPRPIRHHHRRTSQPAPCPTDHTASLAPALPLPRSRSRPCVCAARQVMDASSSLASPTASLGGAPADPFTFTSSATPGALPPPGAGHRRKPSTVRPPRAQGAQPVAEPHAAWCPIGALLRPRAVGQQVQLDSTAFRAAVPAVLVVELSAPAHCVHVPAWAVAGQGHCRGVAAAV
jgi:hypothetical protein